MKSEISQMMCEIIKIGGVPGSQILRQFFAAGPNVVGLNRNVRQKLLGSLNVEVSSRDVTMSAPRGNPLKSARWAARVRLLSGYRVE